MVTLPRCAFLSLSTPLTRPCTYPRIPLCIRHPIQHLPPKCKLSTPRPSSPSTTPQKQQTRGEDILSQVINLVGGITPTQLTQLHKLTDLLLETNQHINLTAIRTRDGVYEKHIADSLTLIPAIEEHVELHVGEHDPNIIDIGSGGGFPGLVLAIARPEWQLTLVESKNKKVEFHKLVVTELGLKNVESLCVRAEVLARDWKYREMYEFAVARSVADMRRLAEFCLPFVKLGGYLLAQKTVDLARTELDGSKKALKLLGGKIASIRPAWGGVNPLRKVGGVALEGRFKAIVQFEKAYTTPGRYPRSSKDIKKKPLGIYK